MSWLDKLLGKKPPPTPEPSLPEPPASPVWEHLRDRMTGQEPFRYAAHILYADGGPDPLDAVDVTWIEDGPHRLYVSHGLAPRGFELCFRLGARPEDRASGGVHASRAPKWPVSLLNLLARRTHRTGRAYKHGHWWQGQKGVLRPLAKFCALAFRLDPQLGALPDGSVQLLTAAAIDLGTVAAMQTDETEGHGDATLDGLAVDNPLGVSWLDRFPGSP